MSGESYEKTPKTDEIATDESKSDGKRDTFLDYTRKISCLTIFNPLTGKRKRFD